MDVAEFLRAIWAYLSGEHRLAIMTLAGDFNGVRMSAVKIGGGCLDGDHHWG